MIKLLPFLAVSIIITVFSCQKDDKEHVYKKIERSTVEYYFKNILNLERIDTMYIKVDTVTPVEVAFMQIVEYRRAIRESSNS